ncbi:MAG: hypothetical protein ACYC0V_13615 [Armatimonadota bacterium]
MDIRTELEHANVLTFDRDGLTDEVIKQLSQEHKILVICDFGKAVDNNERIKYIKALEDASVITNEQIEDVDADKSLAIVVPFHSLQMAERLYRNIPHASHFVSMQVDGEQYSTAC